MQHRIRRLEARDRQPWLALFRAYIAFYGAEVPGHVIELTWSRLTAPEPEFTGLVAVDDTDVPIGFALLLLHRSTWSPTWYCYLEDLFVSPSARGTGCGRALLEAVYREADARGATRTYWVTEAHNNRARKLYDRVATLQPFVQYRR